VKSRLLGVITVPLVRNIFRNAITFSALPHNYEKKKRLSTSSWLPVSQSAWNDVAPNGRIFTKFDISVFLENLMRKFNFSPNLTKITVIYIKKFIYVWPYRPQFFVESRMFLKKKGVEKIKTPFMLSNIFPEIRAFYEIM